MLVRAASAAGTCANAQPIKAASGPVQITFIIICLPKLKLQIRRLAPRFERASGLSSPTMAGFCGGRLFGGMSQEFVKQVEECELAVTARFDIIDAKPDRLVQRLQPRALLGVLGLDKPQTFAQLLACILIAAQADMLRSGRVA